MRAYRVILLMAAGVFAGSGTSVAQSGFGPANPFYAPSPLPFHAPPFDHIRNADYAPAIDAGRSAQIREIEAIANDPAPPDFENTFAAMERSGQLLQRVLQAFRGVTGANTNPALQAVRKDEAPRLAAHEDAIRLNPKLFERVKSVYAQRTALGLKGEQLRLVEVTYEQFVHAGANLSERDKAKLKVLNEEESTLGNAFETKLLAATKSAAFTATEKRSLAGLSEAQVQAAAGAAEARKQPGYVIPLQNTTQQPALASMTDRAAREELFNAGWTRAERGGEEDTRAVIARLAQVRAEKAKLLGYPSYAAWKLEDQMARTPDAVEKFLGDLTPAAVAKVRADASELQAVAGGTPVEAWDWEFYAEQVRKQKFDLDEAATKPYFEIENVLRNGVFYAAHQLYGISFRERKDIPVYQPEMRVFEVTDADGKPLALFYTDYWKRDNKNGGAWMSEFVGQSKLLGTLPVVYNVCNFQKPASGQPALISFSDVTTMFHEFGHALHGMFSDATYPSLAGTAVPRDFVEFPSQFNEHWALYPTVFANYAKHYQTGAAMPAGLVEKIKRARTFNQGYSVTELLAAAQLDMQWHSLPAAAPLQTADAFEQQALQKTDLALKQVPPRYRSSYFMHIWGNGYAAGYYAYLWSEMLDDDAYQWFEEHGGLTRANGDRFRRMVLSRGFTEDLPAMYRSWRGRDPSAAPMLKYRGLESTAASTSK